MGERVRKRQGEHRQRDTLATVSDAEDLVKGIIERAIGSAR